MINDADDVAEIADSVFSIGKQKLFGLVGLLSGVFGFIADVLQPIAPFAFYLFVGFGALCLLTLGIYLKTKKALISLMVLGCITVVLGLVTVFQNVTKSSENGIAANTIPGVLSLQESIGILQDSVDDIKRDTEGLKNLAEENLAESRQLAEKTDRIADDTERTVNAVEAINDSINSIETNGIRKTPISAEDFYHNAKIHELSGDYANARKAYKNYISFNTAKLEPHLRLIDFLRANEGRAGAQEEYAIITRGQKSVIVDYTKLLLIPLSGRKQALIEFQKLHPEFAPAYYHLSREFSVEKLGKQKLRDKRREYQWLEKCKELNDTGGFVRYFVDKERLLQWKNDIELRLIAAKKEKELWGNPVTVLNWKPANMPNLNDNPSVIIGASMYTPSSLVATLSISEPHLEIEIRQSGQDEFLSLGKFDFIDPLTGKQRAAHQFTLSPDMLIPQKIEVKYQDISEEWSEIYTISLEEKHIKSSAVDENGVTEVNPSMHNLLKNNPQKWASFRNFDSSLLLYFTNLVKCRGVIDEVRYSLDSDKLDKVFKLEPFNGLGAAPMNLKNGNSHEIHTRISSNTKFIKIQLSFKDGSKSALIKILNQH